MLESGVAYSIIGAQPAFADMTLEALGAQVRGHIIAGDRAKGKANDHYLAAGLSLVEGKRRIRESSPSERITWPTWLATYCHLKKSRANALIRLAEGRETLA